MKYYSVKKMNEILSFATTWMKFEGLMLRGKIRQKCHMSFHICVFLKKNKPKFIDTEDTGGCQSWRMKGERNT